MGRRLRRELAWVSEPWRRWGVIVPMVVAFCVPALFLAVGFRFERAAGDSTATRVLDSLSADDKGLALTTNGLLRTDQVINVDQRVQDRLGQLGTLGQPIRTLYTPTGAAAVIDDPAREPEHIVAKPRFLARAGAIESLDVIAETDAFTGVYVSQDMAERGGLTVGSLLDVEIEAAGVVVQVQGIYRNLWPTPPGYWNAVPPELVPAWDNVFRQPNSEVLIADESFLALLGVEGTIRWDAPLLAPPQTLQELDMAVRRYRSVEADLVQDDRLVAALEAFAGLSAPVPTVTSSLDEAFEDSREALTTLDRPFASTQAAGVVLGLLVVAANASFYAVRRSDIWRVLVAGGNGTIRLIGLGAVESAVPAVLGAGVGIMVSALVTALIVPGGGAGLAAVHVGPIVWSVVGSVAVWTIVTCSIAVRLGDRRHTSLSRGRGIGVVLLVGVAIAGWIQVGSQSARGVVSALVVFTPIAVLAAAAGVSMMVFRAGLEVLGRRVGWAPWPIVVGVRRIVAASAGATALAGALTVSLGVLVYALALGDTQAASSKAKSATLVGANSSATLTDRFSPDNPAPDGTSLVRTEGTSLHPGDDRVALIIVDPESLADVAAWPSEFGGLTLDEVLAALAPQGAGDVPALRLSSRPVPNEGAFGTTETLPYRIIGTVESAPLVGGQTPVLLMRSDAVDEVARDRFVSRFRREFGRDPTYDEVTQAYRSPLTRMRHRLLSNSSAADLERQLEAQGIRGRDVLDREAERNSASGQVARWSFRYLQFVGFVCVLATLLAAVLYARERKAGRTLADRVGRLAGITRSNSMWAAAIEFGLLALVAIGPSLVAAIAVAGRIAPTFDMMADIPPAIELRLPVGRISMAALLTFLAVVVIGMSSESRVADGGDDE